MIRIEDKKYYRCDGVKPSKSRRIRRQQCKSRRVLRPVCARRPWCKIRRAKEGSMAASTALWSVVDVESFINEYYVAWSGTDEGRIMSYYAENVALQIPGALLEGK